MPLVWIDAGLSLWVPYGALKEVMIITDAYGIAASLNTFLLILKLKYIKINSELSKGNG